MTAAAEQAPVEKQASVEKTAPAERSDALERAGIGALAGLSATVPMTAVMWAICRALPAEEQHEMEPRRVTEGLLRKADALRLGVGRARTLGPHAARLDEGERQGLATLLHFAYGASAGATWMVVDRRAFDSPLVHGALGGLVVWAGGYLGWLPALGILRPEYRRPAGRVAENVVAHLVWGLCAAKVAAAHRKATSDGRTRGPMPDRSPAT